MVEPPATARSWTADLAEIACDLTVAGRRAVRGWRADGAAVARVGAVHAVEATIADAPGALRRPDVEWSSRVAGAILPTVAAVLSALDGRPRDVVDAYIQRFKRTSWRCRRTHRLATVQAARESSARIRLSSRGQPMPRQGVAAPRLA